MNVRSTLLWSAATTALLVSVAARAQEKPCGTTEAYQRLLAEHPELAMQEEDAEHGLQAYLAAKRAARADDNEVYILPVVFHIIYEQGIGDENNNSFGEENITDEQIFNQVAILNRDYRKLNADTANICCGFDTTAADIRVEFRLATKDPYGNCTNGIDRVHSLRTARGGDEAKFNPWLRDRYLNVWIIRTMSEEHDDAAGYAYTPATAQNPFVSPADGIIILHDYIGNVGTGTEGRSRALTHEVGHWLNLSHTWGNTNDPEIACGDDNVGDTPPTKGHDNCFTLIDSECTIQPMDTVYTFQNVTNTSGTSDPTPVPTILLDDGPQRGVDLSPFTAVGVSPNSEVNSAFGFTDWGTGAPDGETVYANLTGAINTGKYYEFTITPYIGRGMKLNSIRFGVKRSDQGPRTFAVRTSLNNFATNIAAASDAHTPGVSIQAGNIFFIPQDASANIDSCTATLAAVDMLLRTTPVTIRIYAWNAEDATGRLEVDNVQVKGTFGLLENIQNYMEYSYCTNMFTKGQRDRMRATLNSGVSGRSNLPLVSTHQFSGIAGFEQSCAPEADFYTAYPFVCSGTPVPFRDNSRKGTPTSWVWTFEGGNPSTSSERNPVVSFNEPGNYDVTLTVSNAQGSTTMMKESYMVIGGNYSEPNGLLNEPFDQQSWTWHEVNREPNMTKWSWSNAAGHNATGCMRLNASQSAMGSFLGDGSGDMDDLISPFMELSGVSGLQLSFWYAYATQTTTLANMTETVDIYYSTDCGHSWRGLLASGDPNYLKGVKLLTAGVRPAGFIPQASDWRQFSMTLPAPVRSSHVRLRFKYTSGVFSNDFYIDDVNISGTVGVDEIERTGASLTLMPNPANDNVTIEVGLATAQKATLSFVDMTGRTVHTRTLAAAQQQRVNVDLQDIGLTSGVYLVRLTHANGQRVERLVVR